MRLLSLKVRKKYGQGMLSRLRYSGLLEPEAKISSQGDELIVPITREPTQEEMRDLEVVDCDLRLEVNDFVMKRRRPMTILEALEGKVPPHALASIPRSIDIIGKVAIVELDETVAPYKKLVGEGILHTHRNVRSVLAKAGPVTDQFRLREVELIAGEDSTLTVQKEHGCLFKLDVRKAFFSPRLASERWRVAEQVRPGEKILDMFAGVGPFSVLIAKLQPSSVVYAVEINPDAYGYLEENAIVNKVTGNVIPICGDVSRVVSAKLVGSTDRVIMNLPASSREYVADACKALRPDGGIVHYYTFQSGPDALDLAREELHSEVIKTSRKIREFRVTKPVKSVAPHKLQVVVDAIVQ